MAEPAGKAFLSHDLRVRILAACNEGEVTVAQFAERNKVPRKTAYNHFYALFKAGFLNRREVQTRGVRLHLYSAAQEPIVTDPEFAGLKIKERRGLSATAIRVYFARCWTSWKDGVFDERDDSHFTFQPVAVDEQGWKEGQGVLMRTFEALYEIKVESRIRLAQSGETPIPTIFGLAGFEVPPALLDPRIDPPSPSGD